MIEHVINQEDIDKGYVVIQGHKLSLLKDVAQVWDVIRVPEKEDSIPFEA